MENGSDCNHFYWLDKFRSLTEVSHLVEGYHVKLAKVPRISRLTAASLTRVRYGFWVWILKRCFWKVIYQTTIDVNKFMK